jgi:hypothetical protein
MRTTHLDFLTLLLVIVIIKSQDHHQEARGDQLSSFSIRPALGERFLRCRKPDILPDCGSVSIFTPRAWILISGSFRHTDSDLPQPVHHSQRAAGSEANFIDREAWGDLAQAEARSGRLEQAVVGRH